jgi:predicted DNA-binding transcriptional regulator YafY
MARNEQLIRQHRILQILERTRFGQSVEEVRDALVEELGLQSLHTRSVLRDLKALQSAGIDVDSHNTPRGKIWRLGPLFKGSFKLTASATELIALSLARDLLFPLAGTPFWVGIETFWTKMRDSLPAPVWEHYEEYRQVVHVRGMATKSYEAKEGILSTIHRSILEHRVVEVEYAAIGEKPSVRRLEPYAVVFYQSSLYIIAALQGSQADEDKIRHWKLDRFQKAQALDVWFKPDRDFDLKSHLGKSLGIFSGGQSKNYKIRISEKASRWVLEDPWHPAQRVESQPDGTVELTVPAVHDLEIIPRVMALGAEAEVLSPTSCRNAIGRMIEQLSEKYAVERKKGR